MRAAIVLGVCVACGPAAREPAPPDASTLPAGVWEPDPGPRRWGARLVADGGDVWFAYTREDGAGTPHAWLTRTTSEGASVVAPLQLDSGDSRPEQVAVARAGANVAIAFHTRGGDATPRVLLVDPTGAPVRAADHTVPLPADVGEGVSTLALVARADGALRLVATHSSGGGEVIVLPLDADGDPAGAPTSLGTADDGVPYGLGAATASDGAALVAWDRRYEQCLGPAPAVAKASRVGASGVAGGVLEVRDHEGTDQLGPAVAVAGDSALLAWSSHLPLSAVIAIARFDEPSTILAEVGDPHRVNAEPLLALAAADRGAIAWVTYEPPMLGVARLRVNATGIAVDEPHVVPLVDVSSPPSPRGLVHVGGERYVVAWTEARADGSRLYATTIDLAQAPSPRPLPPAPPVTTASPRRRCSH